MLRPVWVHRNGEEEPLETDPGLYRAVRLSPDGASAAFVSIERGGDVWIWNFSRSVMDRLTLFPGQDSAPVWTPDGRRILHGSARDGLPEVYSLAIGGTGEPLELELRDTLDAHGLRLFPQRG